MLSTVTFFLASPGSIESGATMVLFAAILSLASMSVAAALWLRPRWFYPFRQTQGPDGIRISLEKQPHNWESKCRLLAIVFIMQAIAFAFWVIVVATR